MSIFVNACLSSLEFHMFTKCGGFVDVYFRPGRFIPEDLRFY